MNMEENAFCEVEPGVLKTINDEIGPEAVGYKGRLYYRFMDFFYIRTKNLDELSPAEVSYLCRARAKYPHLISNVNEDVRRIFKEYARIINPFSLLEIGVGKNPVLGLADCKPKHYILADADQEVVAYHSSIANICYEFSRDVCKLPKYENFFEMAIAVFVFHFPFHTNQILELTTRLKPRGIIVANVYRRSAASRAALTDAIASAGLTIEKVQDYSNLCRDHEYWLLGKDCEQVKKCTSILDKIVNKDY